MARLSARRTALFLGLAFHGLVAGRSAEAQTWITFENETAIRIAPEPGAPYDPPSDDPLIDIREKDYGVGDFDNDGDADVVVVRKQPLNTTGKDRAYLFLNENGVLTNRTSQYAPDLLTPCNNRDIAVVDVDDDGWLDLVTAATFPVDGDAASLKMPRVYMNLGADDDGNWLGLLYKYSDQRIPDFAQDPIFAAVVAGDLDADGDADLFFVDYAADSSVVDPPGGPLFNRLLLNDGNGFFTDVTQTNLIDAGSSAMLGNGFGTRAWIADLDGDDDPDLMAIDTCSAMPRTIRVGLNNGAAFFTASSDLTVGHSPYDFDLGDLNQDDKLDFFEVDDGPDRVFINAGNNMISGLPVFTNVTPPNQSVTTTNGFGGNIYLRDLDGDERLDALVCDENIQLAQVNTRLALFHGLTTSPWLAGAGDPFILGSTACTEPMCTRDTFDVAILDIDLNGLLDLVVGTDTGTKVFLQPPINPPGTDSTAPTIVATLPGDGTVDGLQDRNSAGQLQGVSELTLTFSEAVRDAATDGPVSADSLTLALTTELAGLTPPVVEGVTQLSEGVYIVTLNRPITPGAWTTIVASVEDMAGNALDAAPIALGFLPGDATGNGRVNTQDVLGIIAGINACTTAGNCGSAPVLGLYDMDRNGTLNTQDLLRLIQLLNGVATQNPWNGVVLPPQP